ncbi:MAG: DUF2769 domain-containing protein [Coriobacteriales bacterium]|nr:DUF2769 domain-containing protein [Coriobacteriales bacterium]
MEMQTRTVAFTADNIMKCQCGNCPVQDESACAADKMQALAPMMEQMQGMMGEGSAMMSAQSGMLPSGEDLPGMYCSSGTATCNDLDFDQNCVCPSCKVYTENDLANWKYCNQGSAEQVG